MVSQLSSNSHPEMDDLALYQHLFGSAYGKRVHGRVKEGQGDLIAYINTFVVREMWMRPGLDLKTKMLVAIGMFLALHREEVKFFVIGALTHGATRQEIEEVVILAAVEAGFPAALHGSTWISEAYADYERFEGKSVEG